MSPVANNLVVPPNRGRINWGIRFLGFGLVLYAILVMTALVAVFPRSSPTPDVATRLKAIADERTKNAAELDSVVMHPPTGTTAAETQRLAVAADSVQRVAAAARARADTVALLVLDPSLVPSPVRLFGVTIFSDLSPNWRFFILAMLAGALGAFLHVSQSFATYVGNRTFEWSWTFWYVLRPFIGAALAVVVYVVIRSAIVPGPSAAATNPYGIVALAALSGMFSKQAIDKLNEIFNVAFRAGPGQGDAERIEKATGAKPLPTIASIEPAQPAAVNGTVAFAIRGTGFVPAMIAYLDDIAMTTKFGDATRLDASVAATALAGKSELKLTVRTPPKPGAPATDHGTVSGPMVVTIRSPAA